MGFLSPRIVAVAVVSLLCATAAFAQDSDPRIARLLARISAERLRTYDERLANFRTRHTLSDNNPNDGITAARQWIFDEFKRSGRLKVSFDSYSLPPQGRLTRPLELHNVMAVLPGRSDRRIYVTAHYDTINYMDEGQLRLNIDPATATRDDPNALAPGADDDGSGVSLTLELARVFAESDVQFDATLVFVCWAGEEQAHFGSMAHVQKLAAEHMKVEADFNNDIVGTSHGGNGLNDSETVRVYSEGPDDSPSRALARFIERVGTIYVPSHHVRLMARSDRFGRGSDHFSFHQFGYPAVVFREANENFVRQHGPQDTLEGVDFAYLAKNARVNAASAAALALAPPAPVVNDARGRPRLGRGQTGYDAKLEWQASPGAQGYRVYWRDTWSNSWQHSQYVGQVTDFTLMDVSIDDFVFGVAAVGSDSNESTVASYVLPERRYPEVQVKQPF